MNLKNKKILITGATGGIGNSLVKKFNEHDSLILHRHKWGKIKNSKNNFGKINEKFKLDEHEKIEEFVEKVDRKMEGVEVLVNNANNFR